jgi:large subunit ribosomal protein L28
MSRKCQLTTKTLMYGNKVSHSNIKTSKAFLPNIQPITLRSEILGKNFSFKVATNTIRTIDFKGGLDNFLLNTKSRKLSELGQKLRRQVKKLTKVKV